MKILSGVLATLLLIAVFAALSQEVAPKPIEMSQADQLELSKLQNRVNVLQFNLRDLQVKFNDYNTQLQQVSPQLEALAFKLRDKYKCKDCDFDANLNLVPRAPTPPPAPAAPAEKKK